MAIAESARGMKGRDGEKREGGHMKLEEEQGERGRRKVAWDWSGGGVGT